MESPPPHSSPIQIRSENRPLPDRSAFASDTFKQKRRKSEEIQSCPAAPFKSPPTSRLFQNQSNPICSPFVRVFRASASASLPAPDPSTLWTTETLNTATYFESAFENYGIIGQGGYGVVYKARNKHDCQTYAVKKSRRPFRSLKDREIAMQEIKLVAHMGPHPNCVRCYQAWEQQGYFFIQTEYCELGSLKDYLDTLDHAETEEKIWKFLVAMVLGLKHIHDHGFLHLDIKPANIFLTKDAVKVGDFGSGFQDGMEGDGKYLAPEILQPAMHPITSAADIFSLGLTLLELTAHIDLPLNGPLWQALRQGSVEIPPELGRSSALVALIRAMMHPDARQRPTCSEILAHPVLTAVYHTNTVLESPVPVTDSDDSWEDMEGPPIPHRTPELIDSTFEEFFSPSSSRPEVASMDSAVTIKPKNLLDDFNRVS